ncbi:hypothetical protein Tco_0414123 [Tanacetum coccineum]
MTESPLMDSSFDVPVFSPGDDPIACLNKAMAFLITVASSRFPSTNNQLRTSSNLRNQATIQDGKVTVQQVQGRQGQSYSGTGYKRKLLFWETIKYTSKGLLNATTITGEGHMGSEMAKLFNINSNNAAFLVLRNLKVPYSKTYLNDMENQSVHAMQDFEQTPVVDFTDNEIHSDSNIIPREKMIDSQMDYMIREKLALKEQVDSLEQNLSKQIKEKECLFQTFTVFKNESKEKEDKYIENEIDLEKKIKELDNILFKVGYQNPFHLKKAQRIKPTLYDGIVMSDKHVAMHVIDDEETLILEEESRSKMSEKAKDPEVINKNISHKPIDYEKLNRLTEDFGKHFTPQQELSAEQAFWLRMSDPTSKPSDALPVKIEAPKELPKISLVNESLKKLKFHLVKFDNVVKIRTTPNAHTKVDKQCLEIAKKELLLEIDRLLKQIMSQEVLFTVMNSMSLIGETVNMDGNVESCNLEDELLKSQNAFNDLLKCHSQLEKHCISLECSIQLNQEIFQKRESCDNQNALEVPEFFEKNDLKAQLQDKDSTIYLEPLSPMLLQNRKAHIYYLKYTQEQADILRGIVEQAKAAQPLDKELDFTCVIKEKEKILSSTQIEKILTKKTISLAKELYGPIRVAEYLMRKSSGPGLQCITPATSSSGLVPNTISQQPCIPPNKDDWDYLFQPMFNEYFTPPSNVVSQVQEVVAPRAVDLANSPVSTSINQDAPSSRTPSTQEQEQSPNISQGFKESPKIPIFRDDPLNESPHEESTPQGSSSNIVLVLSDDGVLDDGASWLMEVDTGESAKSTALGATTS